MRGWKNGKYVKKFIHRCWSVWGGNHLNMLFRPKEKILWMQIFLRRGIAKIRPFFGHFQRQINDKNMSKNSSIDVGQFGAGTMPKCFWGQKKRSYGCRFFCDAALRRYGHFWVIFNDKSTIKNVSKNSSIDVGQFGAGTTSICFLGQKKRSYGCRFFCDAALRR